MSGQPREHLDPAIRLATLAALDRVGLLTTKAAAWLLWRRTDRTERARLVMVALKRAELVAFVADGPDRTGYVITDSGRDALKIGVA